jgi:transposase-like protein
MDERYVKVAGRWRYVYPAVDQYGQFIDAGAFHNLERYANNRIEADHGRLKALRPMRGLKRDSSTRVIMRGHAYRRRATLGRGCFGREARSMTRVGVCKRFAAAVVAVAA